MHYVWPHVLKTFVLLWCRFGLRFGAEVVLKRDLYGLKTASISFHKYFGDVIRDLGFKIQRADQDL